MPVKNKSVLHIDVAKNNNQKSDNYGHYYPRVVRIQTLSTRAFAQHIADHGSIYTIDIVVGVLRKFTDCLIEQLSQGKGVKLDGIGVFYPTAKSVKDGAADFDSVKEMGAEQLVEGIHVRFLPKSSSLDNITSKEMKKRCSLQLRNVVTITTTGSGASAKRSHVYTPVEEYVESAPVTP